MRLIAIANIVNNSNKTIGFRLLDIDTKQTKDVPLNNIKSVLTENNIQIDNLRIKQRVVVGSNGTIDRLPKIADNQLIGSSALIVLSQLGNVGYKVSDYKGTVLSIKTEDILVYAKIHGIANGKVVVKEGKEFISSIEGTYQMENIDCYCDTKQIDLTERKEKVQDNKGPYTGTYVTDTNPLLPVITSGIARPTKYSISLPEYYITSYKSGKLDIEKNESMLLEITRDMIQNDMVSHTNKYTLAGNVFRGLGINNKEHLNDIKELLNIQQVRLDIERAIETMKQRKEGKGGKRDTETGLYKPTSQMQYSKIIAQESINKDRTNYEIIPDELISKYLKYIHIMTDHIYSKIECSKSKLALIRKCNSKGIDYKTIVFNEYYWKYNTVAIEELYKNSNEYANVIVEGSEIKIISLDGVYRYNINTLYKEYNRFVVESNRTLKALLVDPTYKEVITARGELKHFSNGLEQMVIPNNVKDIVRGAIKPTKNNKILVFGDNLENCSGQCFELRGTGYNFSPNYVEINCNSKVGLGIVKSLIKIESCLKGAEIIFSRDITPKEYANLLFSRYISNNAKSNKLNHIDDEFILATVKEMLQSNLNNLKILSRPIEFEYVIVGKGTNTKVDSRFDTFKYHFDKFTNIWQANLSNKASKELRDNLTGVIDKANKQLQFRQAELNNSIDKVKKQ